MNRVAESQEIAEKNRLEEMKEKEENRQHRNYLSHLRINNKMVMELFDTYKLSWQLLLICVTFAGDGAKC